MPKSKTANPSGPPTDLDFEKALMFFHAYMYGPLQGKLRIYCARAVHPSGKVQSSDWEVFASMLVKDVGRKLTSGVDLSNNEVKSAESGGSYEYQYHKNKGKEKLRDDTKSGHLFFEHSNNLRLVHLWYLHGSQLREYFEKWLEDYPDPYPQRYRKAVPAGFVRKHGKLLMTLEDGEVTFPKLKSAPAEVASEGAKS